MSGIFVHIVSYNSAPFLKRCVEALLSQEGIPNDWRYQVHITDNASSDESADVIRALGSEVSFEQLSENIGFCGGHNRGLWRFLEGNFDYFLVLNPDVRLAPSAIMQMVDAMQRDRTAGSCCAKLMRANAELEPTSPTLIDSAGMILCASARHFDRGSNENDRGQFDTPEYVFGGTGACLMLRREFVLDATLPPGIYESDIDQIYPQLSAGREQRILLFDEAFFAYREDADLAWRARNLGWRCLYVPSAIGFHKRVVLPENRAKLPPELNLFSVRNRFLLQLNNFSLRADLSKVVPGVLIRNALVVAGVMVKERSSLPALKQAALLSRRALERRALLKRRLRSHTHQKERKSHA